jgi:class 3 adenylate cyclase/tetratricopeptide (TPR) repeat protein
MFTDIVGFSALTQRDEPAALRLLEEHRGILRPMFPRFGGREVKTIGDAFLVEFGSALEATECAIEVQRVLFERNRNRGEDKIEIRIGIHVGDVIHLEQDVYGDAVNIASRIEPLAEPSGICITGPVLEQVANKLPYRWRQIERVSLKNIETPVSVYAAELPWKPPSIARITPFTDRRTDLDFLRGLVDRARRGEGSVVALSGEAGVGKTRLADEAGRQAEKAGFRVLRGQGSRSDTVTPYAHWSEVVREFVRDSPNPLLYKMSANCSSELVRLVPELADRLGPAPEPGPSDPEQARLRFFEGIAQFFENLAKESPYLLILDDLHGADSPSLRLLEYLARKLTGHRTLLMLLYRDAEAEGNAPLKSVLEELAREHLFIPHVVKRLDAEQSAELLSQILGTPAAPSSLSSLVFEKAGGNPMFLETIVHTLIEDGSLVWSSTGWAPKPGAEIRLPERVQQVVRQRLTHLDPEARQVLKVASVLGHQFSFDAVRRMVDLHDEQLLALLEGSLQGRLLVERPTASGASVYEFVDPRVREALYDEISRVRRGQYHLQAGQALEALATSGGHVRSAELARHFLLGNNAEKGLEYSLKAADEEARFFAPEEARRHYETALTLLEDRPDERRRGEVLERMSDELILLGENERALSVRGEAAAVYEKAGLVLSAGNLHRKLALEFSVHNDTARAQEHWVKARQLLESGPESVELARLYDAIGIVDYEAGRPAEAREMLGRAIRIAEKVNDAVVQVDARTTLALIVRPNERAQAFEYLKTAVEIGTRSELRGLVPNVYMVLGMALLHIPGDGRAALRRLEDGIQYARKTGDASSEMGIKGNFLAYTHLRLGDLERAERVAEEYRTYAGEDPLRARATTYVVLGEVAQLRGDLDRAERWLRESEHLLVAGGDWSERVLTELALARWALRRGRVHLALQHLSTAHAAAASAGPPAMWAILQLEALDMLVETYLRAGSVPEAARFRAELSELSTALGEEIGRAYAERAEAFWAINENDLPRAVTHLEACVDIWKKLGWQYELARARVALAALYRVLERPASADPLIELATEYFARIGAKTDPEQTIALEELLSGPIRPPQSSDAPKVA